MPELLNFYNQKALPGGVEQTEEGTVLAKFSDMADVSDLSMITQVVQQAMLMSNTESYDIESDSAFKFKSPQDLHKLSAKKSY